MKTLLKILCFLLYTSLACADTTTQNFTNGSVNILTGNDASVLYQIKNDPTATSYNICDDCVSPAITLPFTFTYFDQPFTQAWMYSNGVLGFQTPTWQGFCCEGEVLRSSMGSVYDYKIMPLWTDLIGGQGNFFSKNYEDKIVFGWYDIKEYGTNNLSSFEVQLNIDNTFKIIYQNVNVLQHTITMGITGNTSAGEYYQFYNGIGSQQPANNTTLSFTTHVDPCANDPLYSTTCPGYDEAYLHFQCSINPLYNTVCDGYAEAYALQQVLQDAGTQSETQTSDQSSQSSSSSTTATTELITTPGMVGDSTSTFQEVRTDVGGASVSSTGSVVVETGVPDIVRDAAPTTNVEPTSTQQTAEPSSSTQAPTAPEEERRQSSTPAIDALAVARNAVAETERTAMAVVNDSIQKSLEDVFNSTGIEEGLLQYVAISNNNMEMMGATGLDNSASYALLDTSYSPISATYESSYNPSAEYSAASITEYATQQISTDLSQDTANVSETIENKQEVADRVSSTDNEQNEKDDNKNKQDLLDMVLKDNKSTQQEDSKDTSDKETVNKSTQENEAASGGINMNEMTGGTSLDTYTKIALLDSPFYQTKEIYKNSKPVDNEKALRKMNYRNDRLHKEMVDQQYNR